MSRLLRYNNIDDRKLPRTPSTYERRSTADGGTMNYRAAVCKLLESLNIK